MRPTVCSALLALASIACAQTVRTVPAVLDDVISVGPDGKLLLKRNGEIVKEAPSPDEYFLSRMIAPPTATETGLRFDFHDPTLNGTMSYGTYLTRQKYPTIAFLPRPVEVKGGVAAIDIKKSFDQANDVEDILIKGEGTIGYRVINSRGIIIYEGRVAVSGKGPYKVLPTVIEGPLVNRPRPTSLLISFETNVPVAGAVTVNGQTFRDAAPATHHEIAVTDLAPDRGYTYTVDVGGRLETHELHTAPSAGSRKPFAFGFVADTRALIAGGERDFTGVNYQVVRAAIASAVARGMNFFQGEGSHTTGRTYTSDAHLLELANLKRAMEPFWASTPMYTLMGNHEWNRLIFEKDSKSKDAAAVDMFPYATESGEATFAQAFVNEENGPDSEDGASYDPNPTTPGDFPTYKRNVYSYTYGNLGMIVLSSEYWKTLDLKISGCPQGYIMDQQLKWFAGEVEKFEKDPNIDHGFVNFHSSMFPTGDHADTGIWYGGHNDMRSNVHGIGNAKGILERRDDLIDIAINHSKKVIGYLVGSEHNFVLLHVTDETVRYPQSYDRRKIKLNRDFYYIQSGGGGTYPYAIENNNPWAKQFQYYSVVPTMAMIRVNGPHVTLEAWNPETFEEICKDVKLR